MLFVKSELLPINSRAGIRENLNIVIVGSSNLIADKAQSHPSAFSCQLNKMSLSDWQYLFFSTAVCLYFCQRKLNVNADPSAVGVAAVAEHAGGTVAGRAVQCCPCRDGLTGCSDEKMCDKDGWSVALAPSRRVSVTGRWGLSQCHSFSFP